MLINPKWKGHSFPTFSSKVTRHQLHFFAKATAEKNPIYTDAMAAKKAGYPALPAPPTFGFSLSIDTPVTFGHVLEMGLPIANFLHGEQSFEYYHPILAGDEITFARTITDIYEKKKGALGFIHEELNLTNQKGVNVGKMKGTLVFVKNTNTAQPTNEKPIVDALLPTTIDADNATPNYTDLKVGDNLPTFVKAPINRTTLALFAGASNDHNPIHIDLDFAQKAGYPDVFAHGMLVMAYMGQALTH